MGATCAVHLGTSFPDVYAGVILESGLQTVKDLPMLAPLSMMIPGADQMLPMLPEPLGTLEKVSFQWKNPDLLFKNPDLLSGILISY